MTCVPRLPATRHELGRLNRSEQAERSADRPLPADHPVPGAMATASLPVHIAEVLDLVMRSGTAPYLERRLRSHNGDKSQLTIVAILVGVVHVGGNTKSYLRTDMTAFYAGLDPQVAVDLGIQRLDADAVPISHTVVNKQFKRFEEALNEGWTDPDGTQCDGKWFTASLIAAVIPAWIAELIEAIAVDGTDFPAWALSRIYTPEKDLLSQKTLNLAEENKKMEEQRKNRGEPEPEDPTEFDEDEGAEGGIAEEIGDLAADGKFIRSKDKEARVGRRSATETRPAGYYLGYELTPAVALQSTTWHGDPYKIAFGDPVAGYVLALGVTPAGKNPGPTGFDTVQAARRIAKGIKEVVADRGFTTKRRSFNRPLHKEGLNVVMDFKKYLIANPVPISLGRRGDAANMHAGTLLHKYTPPPWLVPDKAAIAKLAKAAKQKDIEEGNKILSKAAYKNIGTQHWYAQRYNIYGYTVNQSLDNGGKQVVCPVHAGKAAIPATSQTSPLKAVRIKVPQGTKGMCCPGAISVHCNQLDRFQNVPFGTPAQTASYSRRNQVESIIGQLKVRSALTRDKCQAFGLITHRIAATAVVIAHNMKLTRAAHEEAQATINDADTSDGDTNDDGDTDTDHDHDTGSAEPTAHETHAQQPDNDSEADSTSSDTSRPPPNT